jgi:DNA-binding transcriptional ArsR family regulator
MDDLSDAVFRTLADPTRRHILDLLADGRPLTVSELSAEFPDVVTSNISKHLMNLRATGLVSATRRGREQLYRLEADTLGTVLGPWIAKYERFWSDALLRLRDAAESDEADEERARRKQVLRRRPK